MMIPERPALERRVLSALDGSGGAAPRIPVLLGGCGSGRTSVLLRLRDLIGRTQAHYLDIERGELFMALGRYNGSRGRAAYPDAILAAWRNRWSYDPKAVEPPVPNARIG